MKGGLKSIKDGKWFEVLINHNCMINHDYNQPRLIHPISSNQLGSSNHHSIKALPLNLGFYHSIMVD